MRLLALVDKEINRLVALEVESASYDEETDGLLAYESDESGTEWKLPNVSLEECNDICSELVMTGFCDVTRFGEIE